MPVAEPRLPARRSPSGVCSTNKTAGPVASFRPERSVCRAIRYNGNVTVDTAHVSFACSATS